MWQKPVGDEGFLDSTVDRWRNASASAADAPAPAVLRGPAHALAREPC
jgi:hypothetical protein